MIARSLLVILIALSGFWGRAGEASVTDWDKNLPDMKTGEVDITGETMQEVWMNFSTKVMAHSVLFVHADFSGDGSFHFQRKEATVREFLDALVLRYPTYAWEQDAMSGVIWIHPRDVAVKDLLSAKLKVTQNYSGLRMQEDILERLASNPFSGLIVTKGGTGLNNTFDYPVSLSAGDYCVRDIINQCCAADPSKGFRILEYDKRRAPLVTAANFADCGAKDSAGARTWWRREVGAATSSGASPTLEEIGVALANPDPLKRENGRKYLSITACDTMVEDLVASTTNSTNGLWINLGAIAIYARGAGTTLTAAIKKLQTILDSGSTLDGDLTFLADLELLRLTKDQKWLKVMQETKHSTQLEPVRDDASRILYLFGDAEQRTSLLAAFPFLPAAQNLKRMFQFQEQQ